MHLLASSTISYQPTFGKKGFFSVLAEKNPQPEPITPDYSAFIPAMDRRRMSQVLKMAIACSMDCLEQAGISQPDGIIVGTAMGCSTHTRNFLDKIISADDGPLSPTSFIVSTHNTIAGQISLLLKNHGYNMTHTQNSLSFEHALADAMLCISSGYKHVLVGGADEEEHTLYNMKERLNDETITLTGGASFFILAGKQAGQGGVHLTDVGAFGLISDIPGTITEFLETNKLVATAIDLVLYANCDQRKTDQLKSIFGEDKMADYHKMAGTYYTNAAFGMHCGIDMLSHGKNTVSGEKIKRVLVCNNLIPENLGLILLENKSANIETH